MNFSGVVLTALASVAPALCWNAALAASHRAKLSCFLFWLLLAVALNPDLVRCCPGSNSPREDMEVTEEEDVESWRGSAQWDSLGTYTEDKAESSAAIPSSQQSGPRRRPLGA